MNMIYFTQTEVIYESNKKNIYIYLYIYGKKRQTSHIRIINLFPFCYVFLIKSKNTKKINKTSSDLIDFYQNPITGWK